MEKSHNFNCDLTPVQIQIQRLHCYHCSRTFLTQDAFAYHAHDDELSSSSASSSSEESDADDSDDSSLIILNSPSNSNPNDTRRNTDKKKKTKKRKSENDTSSSSSDLDNSTTTNTNTNIKNKKLIKTKTKMVKLKNPYSCPMENCGAGFQTYGDRKIHLQKVHNQVFPPPSAEEQEARRNYICPVETCLKRFLSASNLSSHKLSHREATLPCPHEGCVRYFTLPYLLNKHVKEIHSTKTTTTDGDGNLIESEPGFECTICFKKLKTKRNLKNHLRFSHDPDIAKRYKCHLCPDRGFPTKSYLKDHLVRMHEGKNNFQCEQCGKLFSHRQSHNKHVKVTHLGIKKFMCHICPVRYASSSRLAEHVKTVHEKIYEHLCSICGKYLSCNKNLKRHLIGHTGAKPCKCPFLGCSAAYTQTPSLKIHIQKHHAGEDPNLNTNININFI